MLMRITGMFSTERLVEMFQGKLTSSTLILRDTFCFSSDEVTVMKKIRKLPPTLEQLCHDSLHCPEQEEKKDSRWHPVTGPGHWGRWECGRRWWWWASGTWVEWKTKGLLPTKRSRVSLTRYENACASLPQVTKEKEILITYVKVHPRKKDLKLILDCKTHWSSLCAMLDRHLEYQSCIVQTRWGRKKHLLWAIRFWRHGANCLSSNAYESKS